MHLSNVGKLGRDIMKFKRPQVEDIHINLTPMIDCLLFILVFLLLSTTFAQNSRINLTLPDAQGVPPNNTIKKSRSW
jgi:biopolymer transport protein ExbD